MGVLPIGKPRVSPLRFFNDEGTESAEVAMSGGTTKLRNKNETKRNEMKRKMKKRNETKYHKTKRNISSKA